MKLAIKGHSTRGKEVIELLEMMGGANPFLNNGYVIGNKESLCYYIYENTTAKYISWDYIGPEEINEYRIFTLEEFEQKFPYKVGDKVKNTCGAYGKVYEMKWIDDEIQYRLDFGHHISGWYNVCELQPYKKETIEESANKAISDMSLNDIYSIIKCKTIGQGTYAINMNGYKFDHIDENGNIIVKSITPKYPKTYQECCEVLGISSYFEPEIRNATTEECHKFTKLIRLKRCRDAYWKIAGEQMGLDEPWKPDWNDLNRKYFISLTCDGIGLYDDFRNPQILAFPTKEMRDAFYENFKDLIEECKELL